MAEKTATTNLQLTQTSSANLPPKTVKTNLQFVQTSASIFGECALNVRPNSLSKRKEKRFWNWIWLLKWFSSAQVQSSQVQFNRGLFLKVEGGGENQTLAQIQSLWWDEWPFYGHGGGGWGSSQIRLKKMAPATQVRPRGIKQGIPCKGEDANSLRMSPSIHVFFWQKIAVQLAVVVFYRQTGQAVR